MNEIVHYINEFVHSYNKEYYFLKNKQKLREFVEMFHYIYEFFSLK